jgi:hypothetical protein
MKGIDAMDLGDVGFFEIFSKLFDPQHAKQISEISRKTNHFFFRQFKRKANFDNLKKENIGVLKGNF